MSETKRSGGNKVLLYVIGILILLLVVSWIWKGVAVGRAEKVVEKELAELVAQREVLEQRLRAESDARVEEVLRLMGVPLGWAVRTEAIRDDLDQIEEYATHLLKEPRVQRVVLVNAEGHVQLSTDRKLQGSLASAHYGDLASSSEIALRREESGDYQLMVPILGYNSRLGSLIVNVDGR
jgi:hypothetical protein